LCNHCSCIIIDDSVRKRINNGKQYCVFFPQLCHDVFTWSIYDGEKKRTYYLLWNMWPVLSLWLMTCLYVVFKMVTILWTAFTYNGPKCILISLWFSFHPDKFFFICIIYTDIILCSSRAWIFSFFFFIKWCFSRTIIIH